MPGGMPECAAVSRSAGNREGSPLKGVKVGKGMNERNRDRSRNPKRFSQIFREVEKSKLDLGSAGVLTVVWNNPERRRPCVELGNCAVCKTLWRK